MFGLTEFFNNYKSCFFRLFIQAQTGGVEEMVWVAESTVKVLWEGMVVTAAGREAVGRARGWCGV